MTISFSNAGAARLAQRLNGRIVKLLLCGITLDSAGPKLFPQSLCILQCMHNINSSINLGKSGGDLPLSDKVYCSRTNRLL